MTTFPIREAAARAGRALPRIAATLLLVATFGMAPQAALADFEGGSAPCASRPALPEGRPRIGLALGGGGARGVAHISVLRKLEEMKVPVDCIAGTSMGALVGAMYASGMSVDEIERTVLTMDWPAMFDDSLPRPERSYRRKRDDELVIAAPGIGIGAKGVKVAAGLLAGERILLLFEKMIEPVATIEEFDRLPIPYRAVAADINTGEPLVIEGGDLALAMRASMSIPGAFPPVQVGDHVVVDGGVARNIPIDVVRDMGADIIIAVDVGTPLATMTTQSNLLSLTGQVIGILTVNNTRAQLATLTERDVLISPPLGDKVETGDFSKGVEALAIGKEGVEAVVPKLALLSVPDAAYAQNLSVRTGRATSPPVVHFVRVDNQTSYRDELVLARAAIPLGQPLDSAKLEQGLFQLFGMETLSQATYEIVEEDGRTGVILHVREKVQGPNYVEAGLSMSGDFDGRFDFSLRVGVRQSPINDSGGELRYLLRMGDESGLLAEYYQPFGDLARYFFGTRAEYDNRQINFFDEAGNNTAEYDVSQTGIQLVVGREFGTIGAVTFGYRRLTGDAEVQIGDPALPEFDVDTGEVFLEGAVDRLDSFYFPRDGYLTRGRYTFSRDGLGADTNFEQFDFDGIVARTFGDHSAQLGLRYHVTTSGVAPIQSLYRLGGFSRLVGFQQNELTGQHYAVLIGGYSYEIGDLFNQPALAGAQLEYGNVWQQRSDMDIEDGILNGSVYIGLDSWLGPILFGIGAREGNHYNLFLEVGHRF